MFDDTRWNVLTLVHVCRYDIRRRSEAGVAWKTYTEDNAIRRPKRRVLVPVAVQALRLQRAFQQL